MTLLMVGESYCFKLSSTAGDSFFTFGRFGAGIIVLPWTDRTSISQIVVKLRRENCTDSRREHVPPLVET